MPGEVLYGAKDEPAADPHDIKGWQGDGEGKSDDSTDEYVVVHRDGQYDEGDDRHDDRDRNGDQHRGRGRHEGRDSHQVAKASFWGGLFGGGKSKSSGWPDSNFFGKFFGGRKSH